MESTWYSESALDDPAHLEEEAGSMESSSWYSMLAWCPNSSSVYEASRWESCSVGLPSGMLSRCRLRFSMSLPSAMSVQVLLPVSYVSQLRCPAMLPSLLTERNYCASAAVMAPVCMAAACSSSDRASNWCRHEHVDMASWTVTDVAKPTSAICTLTDSPKRTSPTKSEGAWHRCSGRESQPRHRLCQSRRRCSEEEYVNEGEV